MSAWLNFVVAEMVHAAEVRKIRANNLITRYKYWSFDDMSDTAFIKRFRLTKGLAWQLIEELRPSITPTLRSDGLDAATKVLIALQFMACGSYQTQVGDVKHLCVSQSSVSKAIHEVLKAMNEVEIFTKYVAFPSASDRQGREHIKREFYNKFRMPGVLGCIDGTHVAMIRPELHEERYINRKGYHSMNVMIVCDSDLRILCVDPSYPGSTHDSTVWKHHRIRAELERTSISTGEEFYLLGDSGYPLRKTLMTPILNADPDTPEAHYTDLHMTTRNVVERCIGVLKARYRCLLAARALHYDPLTVAEIVNACCLLHNIAHGAGLPYTPLSTQEWEQETNRTRGASLVRSPSDTNSQSANANSELRQGQQLRTRLVSRLWQERY